MKKTKLVYKLKRPVIDRFIAFCDREVTWTKVIEFHKANPKLDLTREQLRELFRNKFNEDENN